MKRLILFALVSFMPNAAFGTLIGDTVEISSFALNNSGPVVVADPGVEFTILGGGISFFHDVRASSLKVTRGRMART